MSNNSAISKVHSHLWVVNSSVFVGSGWLEVKLAPCVINISKQKQSQVCFKSFFISKQLRSKVDDILNFPLSS